MNKLRSCFGQLFTDQKTAYSCWCVHVYVYMPHTLSTLQYFLRSYWHLYITENHLGSMVLNRLLMLERAKKKKKNPLPAKNNADHIKG